jgi:hypothetical protein
LAPNLLKEAPSRKEQQMENEKIWVVVAENPGIQVRIVKKATAPEQTQ